LLQGKRESGKHLKESSFRRFMVSMARKATQGKSVEQKGEKEHSFVAPGGVLVSNRRKRTVIVGCRHLQNRDHGTLTPWGAYVLKKPHQPQRAMKNIDSKNRLTTSLHGEKKNTSKTLK